MKENHKIQIIVFKKTEEQILYLLLKRIPDKGGFWQPVTGRCEGNETHLETAKRELKEETGITKIKRLIEDVHEFIVEGDKSLEKVFGAEVQEDVEINLDNNIYQEHDKIKWVPYEEAINSLKWPQNKKALENLNRILTNN